MHSNSQHIQIPVANERKKIRMVPDDALGWVAFTKPSQAKPEAIMFCPCSGNQYTVKRRGKVEGRVGILIEFKEGNDVAVVDAKNNWLVHC